LIEPQPAFDRKDNAQSKLDFEGLRPDRSAALDHSGERLAALRRVNIANRISQTSLIVKKFTLG